MSAVHRIVGPYVITDREDMEKAFQRAFANYYQPLGIEVRWLNYTTRPATNFGALCLKPCSVQQAVAVSFEHE